MSRITNRWGQACTTAVPTREVTIFAGHEGARYSHHHQLTALNGVLYATWSNAAIHEDSPGQHVMIATSDDLGDTWSEERVLVGPIAGEFEDAVLNATGIHVHDGRMVAYYGHYDYNKDGLRLLYEQTTGLNGKADTSVSWHQDVYTGILVSDDAGETWQDAGRIAGFISYIQPHRLRSERLVLPGQMRHPWTDDPFGVEGWTIASIPGLPDDYVDCSQGFHFGKQFRGDKFTCSEGSCFETDDDVVHMMLRSEINKLVVAESHDDGVTYGEPELTDYTDANCRFHFGRLPDGRFIGLSCPSPRATDFRTPMILATSDDGVVFDTHYVLGDEPNRPPRANGIQKFGRYGYPSFYLLGDNIHVIYSIGKEDIATMRVPLDALGN